MTSAREQPVGDEGLRSALREMVYETTHLSPMEVDGSHKCTISATTLENARKALATSPTPDSKEPTHD